MYRSYAEIQFIDLFNGDQRGWALLRGIRNEQSQREREEFFGRSQGRCCSRRKDREHYMRKLEIDLGCCEKGDPEWWEITRNRI
jgi:hypothetical protein